MARSRRLSEEPVLGGDGSVDVALYRDQRKIACEIGVSTNIEHEVANVAKCREAGFEEVIVIAAEGRDAKKLDAALAGSAQVMRPEEFIEYLDEAAPPEPKTRERTHLSLIDYLPFSSPNSRVV